LPITQTANFQLDSLGFGGAGKAFARLGAAAFVRHLKTGCEDPWWPTAVPTGSNGEPLWTGDLWSGVVCSGRPKLSNAGRDVAREIIE
jgi:hypothetical protein